MPRENQKVIGIVLVSHCRLAEEMARVAELIVGPLRSCKAVCFDSHESVEEKMEQLGNAIAETNEGRGVLVLTDLFGGSPANISLSFLGPEVEVVCGMNLPMLIKLAGCRAEYTLGETASLVKEYGQRHITLASEVLARSVKAS